jgi:ParB-like chromosome segregation protein Spo0J
MAKPSYRGLIDAKIIKRTDNGMAVLPANIRIREGFNLRDVNADDYESDIQALMAHIKRGGKYPALEVVLADDGFQGVDVVDGHRRLTALRRLIEQGDPIEFIRIEPFVGNDIDQLQRIMTSNEGRRLTALEIAEGYRRMAAYGLTPDDIARRIGKTRQHVDQMLILATAPHEVQQMVKAGDVSATEAINVTRHHGSKAVDKLKAAQAKAGGKVTAKALKPWTPPAKMVAPLVDSVQSLAASITPEVRSSLFWMESEHRLDSERVRVDLPASALWALISQQADIEEARKDAAEKQRAKAAQASQGDLVAAADGA